MSGWPRVGQRRQQIDGAVVALHEKFGEAGRAAKVAVDLERRVRIEKIRVGAAAVGMLVPRSPTSRS